MRGYDPWSLAAALILSVAACAPVPPLPSSQSTSPSAAPSTHAPTAWPPASPSPGSGTLIVTQAFVGEGFYTEGAYAYVELLDTTGSIVHQAETTEYHLEQELGQFIVDHGRYKVRSYVRACEAACPALDAPTAACDASIELKPGDEVRIRIERTLRSCEVRTL